jgi:hypothetical protein
MARGGRMTEDALRSLVASLRSRADHADARRFGSGDTSYYAGLTTAYREAADDLDSLAGDDEAAA